MFGIGIPELVVILIVGLIIFGPGKLPEVGRAVGKGLREFRKASSALQSALNEPEKPAPSPAPAAAPAPAPEPPQTAAVQPAASAETAASPKEEPSAAAPAEPMPQATAAEPAAEAPAYEPPTQESVRKQIEEQQKKA